MPGIDHRELVRAMDNVGITPKALAEEIDRSLGYVCDLRSGRRTLKRNPQLRKRIAEALNVRVRSIEYHPEDAEAA